MIFMLQEKRWFWQLCCNLENKRCNQGWWSTSHTWSKNYFYTVHGLFPKANPYTALTENMSVVNSSPSGPSTMRKEPVTITGVIKSEWLSVCLVSMLWEETDDNNNSISPTLQYDHSQEGLCLQWIMAMRMRLWKWYFSCHWPQKRPFYASKWQAVVTYSVS